jgi:hypothetical protein
VNPEGLTLREGLDLAGIGIDDLWQRYVALGGDGTRARLEWQVDRPDSADDHEHTLIAQAINEVFLERGADHPVAYRQPNEEPPARL